jgi:hypothetical protein
LPAGANNGDGTSVTTQKYSLSGTWTITVTDASDPTIKATRQVTLPFAGAPAIELTVADTGATPPSRTWTATWDNHSQGPVKLFWGDSTDPADGTSQAESGNASHTYDDAVVSPVTVKVVDARVSTRQATQQVTLP